MYLSNILQKDRLMPKLALETDFSTETIVCRPAVQLIKYAS